MKLEHIFKNGQVPKPRKLRMTKKLKESIEKLQAAQDKILEMKRNNLRYE